LIARVDTVPDTVSPVCVSDHDTVVAPCESSAEPVHVPEKAVKGAGTVVVAGGMGCGVGATTVGDPPHDASNAAHVAAATPAETGPGTRILSGF
jgi:hypothetical protein